jgi:hypothetical protein
VRRWKAALDAKEEPKRLTFLCEQLYRGGCHQDYKACDLYVLSIGDKASVQRVPKNADKAAHARFLDSVVKTLSTLGINCGANTSLTSK